MSRQDYGRDAEKLTLTRDHASTAATLTQKLYKVPAGRTLHVDRVTYLNVTGLALDASNNFAVAYKNAAVVVASGIDTTAVALPANTFVEMTPGASSAVVLQAGDELTLVATKTGTQTLPAGTSTIEGRLF